MSFYPADTPDRDGWMAETVATYAAMFATGVPFAQATYGDGEWQCMLGLRGGVNDNDEPYIPELGDALLGTLLHHRNQWCALWPGGAGGRARAKADEWMRAHAHLRIPWIPFRPVQWAAVHGKAAPLFRAMGRRSVMLVGPPHMDELDPKLLRPHWRATVPVDGTAWKHAAEIATEIERTVEDGALVLIAAGFASNLIIHRLWPGLRYQGVTLYDIGSVLDPYCGVFSRQVYRHPEWQAGPMRENLP